MSFAGWGAAGLVGCQRVEVAGFVLAHEDAAERGLRCFWWGGARDGAMRSGRMRRRGRATLLKPPRTQDFRHCAANGLFCVEMHLFGHKMSMFASERLHFLVNCFSSGLECFIPCVKCFLSRMKVFLSLAKGLLSSTKSFISLAKGLLSGVKVFLSSAKGFISDVKGFLSAVE